MIGQWEIHGSDVYLHINEYGTLKKMNKVRWYWQILGYIRNHFKPFTYSESIMFFEKHSI